MSPAGRLPKTVLPRRYDLTIGPDLDASTFTGRVSIEIEVREPTATIALHAKDLDIGHAAVRQGAAAIGATAALDADHDLVVLTLDRLLEAGAATVELHFAGAISHGLLGFYRSTFVDGESRLQVIAATQFEAPHARRAFPCFDEPEFKAVFAITLEVADGLLAISNSPEIARTVNGGIARVSFADTIPMSTYLVAWVVGPLELTDAVDAGGVAVRVAHVPGRGHLTRFALDLGAFAITYFTGYYGIPYPGAKCDLVALPDFSFGAMENLGCVTFRETRLLLDPDRVSLDEMASAALTIVHEIAHMWFGDLVTMKWWNGIWLNEAFATFMEHLGLDAYRPEWKTWDDFALGRAAALDVDALATTRTVEYEVVTPADAEGMFDLLTYQKGGSVLRMLERWLGADAFRGGVRLYLDRYRFANTETTDLWDALEEATREPVRRIMDTWIFQPGLPAVRVDGDRLRIEQRRFTYEDGDREGLWVLPLLARVHNGGRAETRSLLLSEKEMTIDAPADALVVLNAGGEGFYRVAYPREQRDRLLDAGVLEPLERFALVDDLWASVLAGEISAEEFLGCAHRFTDETDLVVWKVLIAHLRAAARLVTGDALERMHAEIAAIVGPARERLGWDARPADDPRTRQLRGLMIDALGSTVGDRSTIARAREVDAAGTRDPDVEAAAVAVVASAGTRDDFDRFLARSAAASSPQAQLRYLYALGEFPSEEMVLQACELAISDEVRAQNGPFLLQRALRNREHGAAAWAFVRDHWDTVRTRFSPGLLPRVIEGTTWLVEDAVAGDVLTFVDAHPVAAGARTIAQHMERLRVHRAAVGRERGRLSAALLGGAST
ncbi:MAG TPA: M1 family metallopeptidase [Acidimicrobiia bacterium]|nr:M1 family metallopeptidase [Acidimicrobiia bacterium]